MLNTLDPNPIMIIWTLVFLLVLLVPLTITAMPFKCQGSRLRKLLRLNILGV